MMRNWIVRLLCQIAIRLSRRGRIVRDLLRDGGPMPLSCDKYTLFGINPVAHTIWMECDGGAYAFDLRESHWFRLPHGSHHIAISFSGTSQSGTGTQLRYPAKVPGRINDEP